MTANTPPDLEALEALLAADQATYLRLQAAAVNALPHLIAALRDAREALEPAWREGFQNARDCLTDDEAFCLTADVEQDTWADSRARATLRKLEKNDG